MKNYIVTHTQIANVPQDIYHEGFEDLLNDMDDAVKLSYFIRKYNVTEGIQVESFGGYDSPAISVYIDYDSWCEWTAEMQNFWMNDFNPDLHKKELNEHGITCVSSKLSTEEIDQIVYSISELEELFAA